jgi:hypothetical protein
MERLDVGAMASVLADASMAAARISSIGFAGAVRAVPRPRPAYPGEADVMRMSARDAVPAAASSATPADEEMGEGGGGARWPRAVVFVLLGQRVWMCADQNVAGLCAEMDAVIERCAAGVVCPRCPHAPSDSSLLRV